MSNTNRGSAASTRSTKTTPASSSASPAAAGDVKPETSATSKDDVTADREPVDYPGLRGTEHEVTPETARSQAERDELAQRDRTIAELRAQLAATNATPGGAQTEMEKRVAALTAEVERMKTGAGHVPVPEPLEPDPYLYNVVLGCGDRVDGQHPHATHHFCKEHGTQRVDRVFPKSVEQLAEQLA